MRARRVTVARAAGWTFLGLAIANPSTASVAAQGPGRPVVPEVVKGPVGEAVDDLMRRSAAFGWAGQVLLEMDGEVVLNRAYGVAERRTGRPFQIDTPVGIASISKVITAIAVLRLHDQGSLDLDDRLGDLLTDVPAEKVNITVHQLLTHTSGIRGGDIVDDFEAESREELVGKILAQPLGGDPGSGWEYANSGFSILAAIVHEVSGRSFHDFVRMEILEPAGMRDTEFGSWTKRDDHAHAYIGLADQGAPSTWPVNWRTYGAGGMTSTAADLYRLEVALRDGLLLRPATFERMMAHQARLGPDGSFGYAFFRGGDEGARYVEHGGDWQRGYNGLFMRYLDAGHRLFMTSNARDQAGMWMRHDVAVFIEMALRGEEIPAVRTAPPSMPATPSERLDLPGAYRLPDGSRILIQDDGTHLWAVPEGSMASALLTGISDRSANALAEAKTARLLGSLIDGEATEGFARALEEEGAPFLPDYRSEWESLVAERGPVRGYTLAGAVRAGRDVRTQVLLQHDESTTGMQFLWREAATGRLGGTLVRPDFLPLPWVVALAVRRVDGDRLWGQDLYWERGTAFQPIRSDSGRITGLRVGPDGVEARREGGD